MMSRRARKGISMEWAEVLVPAVLVALAIFISVGVGILLWRRYRRERQDRS